MCFYAFAFFDKDVKLTLLYRKSNERASIPDVVLKKFMCSKGFGERVVLYGKILFCDLTS